jgi:hypothetical protein
VTAEKTTYNYFCRKSVGEYFENHKETARYSKNGPNILSDSITILSTNSGFLHQYLMILKKTLHVLFMRAVKQINNSLLQRKMKKM